MPEQDARATIARPDEPDSAQERFDGLRFPTLSKRGLRPKTVGGGLQELSISVLAKTHAGTDRVFYAKSLARVVQTEHNVASWF